MSGTQWPHEQILLFLEALQSEPIIWNPTESGHKDKKKINDAWVRIQDILEIPVEELKKKKDSLFATYRGYCRKKDTSIKSGAGVNEVYHPVWFAFDFMDSFLGSVFKCKPTISMDPATNSIKEEHNASKTVEPTTSPTPREQNSISSQTKPTIWRRDHPPELQVACKQMTEAFNNLNKIINKKPANDGSDIEDECDIFGKLIAKKLKKIPEYERDDVMFDIHRLLRRQRAEKSQSIESLRSSTPSNSLITSNVSIKRPKSAKMIKKPRPHSSFSEPPISYVTSGQSSDSQHTYIEQPNEDTSH